MKKAILTLGAILLFIVTSIGQQNSTGNQTGTPKNRMDPRNRDSIITIRQNSDTMLNGVPRIKQGTDGGDRTNIDSTATMTR